ncbi:hypothetical protein E8E11_010784 [Didymella keratinophila]|nr:hypothetical protein E8E11_010784 [Didymella keratinophila]
MKPKDRHPTPLPFSKGLSAWQAENSASARLKLERAVSIRRKAIERNYAKWGFLRLPPELRNYIYDYVLAGDRYLLANDEARIWDKGLWSFQDQNQFAFLRVCHDIHAEIAFLPLARNVLFFRHQPLGSRFWKKPSMRQKEHIQHVGLALATASCPRNRFVNRVPNTTKKEGLVTEFDFLRALSGLKHIQIVWMSRDDPPGQMAQEEVEVIMSEVRSAAIEGTTISAV